MDSLDYSLLDQINAEAISAHTLINSVEQEYEALLEEQTKRKAKNYLSNYRNLTQSRIFHLIRENTISANALNLDIEICSKALGKRKIKSLQLI